MKELLEHKWGGSGIEKTLFEFILNEFPIGITIIELGSGYCSTKAFSFYYKTYSIDDNKDYQGFFENVNYIHAQKINGWYDPEIILSSIPKDYSLVFVDGPAGEGNRSGLLNNLHLFKNDVSFIFHDTYRESEKKLAIDVAKKLKREITFFENGDFWGYIK